MSSEWENISKDAKELVQGLLVKDPERRMTLHECLQHPWVSDRLLTAPLTQPLDLVHLQQFA